MTVEISQNEAMGKVMSGLGIGCGLQGLLYLAAAILTFGMVYYQPFWMRVRWVSVSYGIPLIVATAWFLSIRRSHPYFARGLSYSILVVIAILLGALKFCTGPIGGNP